MSKPQPNLNTTVRFDKKLTLQTPSHKLNVSNISADTLKVGSCEHLEQIPTVRVAFVHATFVLATFVHIRNISAVTDPILMKLYRLGSWEHLEQIPTVTVTFVQAIFVQATFVLVTFVHIRNISDVTDTIWTKL